MKKYVIALLIGMLLTSCSKETPSVQPEPDPVQTEPRENKDIQNNHSNSENDYMQTDENNDNQVNLQHYFPQESITKYFKGSGNEFASEIERIHFREGNYHYTTVDNGGTRFLRIYKVIETGIFKVFEQPDFYEEQLPELQAIQPNFNEQAILELPLEEGKAVNGWKIVDIDYTLTVPYGELKNVIVLEMTNGDQSINRQYWAPQFGLVKKEYFYKDETGEETIVTSELERIEEAAN